MTAKKDDAPAEPIVTETAPVVDPTVTSDEWVEVRHKDEPKDSPTALMPRAYFDGWGKDKGFVEAK